LKQQFTYLGGAFFFPALLWATTLQLGCFLPLPRSLALNGDPFLTMVILVAIVKIVGLLLLRNARIPKGDDEIGNQEMDWIHTGEDK
jgi:formate-dependent nitrite reductase membrane component NrfD